MAQKSIVFQAIPFCFGPAAHIIAVAEQVLSRGCDDSIKTIGLASGTVLDLLRKSNILNNIIEYNTNTELNSAVLNTLDKTDIIVCIGDFDFLRIASSYRHKILFVDALFWMWDSIPPEFGMAHKTFVLDFPGVRERLHQYLREKNPCPDIEVLDQFCAVFPHRTKPMKNGNILVNFGGIDSPLGANDNLLLSLIEDIVMAWKDISTDNMLEIRGGTQALERILDKTELSMDGVIFGAIGQQDFFHSLHSCSHLLTVPGMSIVYEALHTKIPTMFLLPLNYSQHGQMAFYSNALVDPSCIKFEDLPGFGKLPNQLPEKDGIAMAFEYGKRFRDNPEARAILRSRVSDFLLNQSAESLRLNNNSNNDFLRNVCGAGILADIILQYIGKDER
jgi:hypothetical protein